MSKHSVHKVASTSGAKQSDADVCRRNTPARRQLIDMLADTQTPLSVGQLLEGLERAGLVVNKTTVYRQLESLVAQGLATEIDLGEGRKRYESVRGDRSHPHLVCKACGKVECLPSDDALAPFERKIEDSRGFEIEDSSLEFYGTCVDCREKRTD